MISVIVLRLNYLALNRPPVCPPQFRVGRGLSRDQWLVVKRLEGFLDAWLDASDIDAEGMGRTAPKIESLEEALASLTEKCAGLKLSETADYFRYANDSVSPGHSLRDAGRLVGESKHACYS